MKIFYYFLEYPTPMYRWQHDNLIDELRRAGHEVVTFNPALYPTPAQANEAALAQLRASAGWHLFMSCDDQHILLPDTVRAVAAMGIPTLLIAWDNLELPYKQRRIAPLFDAVWLTSHETAYLFEKWGCRNIIFLPYAANPFTYTPAPAAPPRRSVVFVGSPYGSRTNKINHLTASGIPVDIYSNALSSPTYNSSVKGQAKRFDPADIAVKASRYLRFPIGRQVLWSTILNKLKRDAPLCIDSPLLIPHPSVSFEQMCALYSAHALALNISELRDTYILPTPIHKLHLRTFEIPMCGGLQFTWRTPEIEQYFDDSREIVLYDSREEMADKALFYLNPKRDSQVARLKAAARRRAESCHTWTARFNRIFASLGLLSAN
ncbi:MAG: glycosyltransferase [Duncaniella sp.]|nr:glycosyltransferase [Duncaniella sp.]